MSTRTYRHPELGFSLPLFADWEATEDVPGCALVAVEPERGPHFRANVVVTVEEAGAAGDLEEWVDRQVEGLRRSLVRPWLLDRETTEVGGRPAVRVLAHHYVSEHAVTLEQWTLLAGDHSLVLTASCDTLEYDEFAVLSHGIAERFRPADPP